jgi:hypothetical protein
VTPLYLTEVVWPAASDMAGRPFNFRLVAQCATKTDCDKQAQGRAKAHAESGFDSSRDAWWGRSGDRVYYYHQTNSRPGRLWNGIKPGSYRRIRRRVSRDGLLERSSPCRAT